MIKKNPNSPTYVVGYEFTNKQGLAARVIAYRGRKDIDIMFEDGAVVEKTTGSYIAKGLPMHPTLGKIQAGDKFPCANGDTVEVIEYKTSSKILCRWLSDGAEKWTLAETLRGGVNRHPFNWKFSAGDIVETNFHGRVDVVEYNSATDVVVKFSDGSLKTTTASALRSGVLRPDFGGREGHTFKTNSGWVGTVVAWENAQAVTVRWQDGSESKETWSGIVSGSIKPLFQPNVCGVGFVGEGRYLPNSYKLLESQTDKEYVHPRIYAYWQRMITRCYNEKEQQKPSCRAYIGCTVVEDWFNFQNFAKWALTKEQCNFTEGSKIWELDKDLLVYGNRVYGPTTCTFLPPEINIFLSDREWSQNCPRGVNYIKPASANAKEGWVARCHLNGVREYLGYYDDPMLAFYKYKQVKEDYARELAEKYRDRLESEAYANLLKYAVEPYN